MARLYLAKDRALVHAGKQNRERIPSDFIFQASKGEFQNSRFHFGASSFWGDRRYPPYVFTEHGVAMLSSVLRGKKAAQVNIATMPAFIRLRQTPALQGELAPLPLRALGRQVRRVQPFPAGQSLELPRLGTGVSLPEYSEVVPG